jgi:hypothetical protein
MLFPAVVVFLALPADDGDFPLRGIIFALFAAVVVFLCVTEAHL